MATIYTPTGLLVYLAGVLPCIMSQYRLCPMRNNAMKIRCLKILLTLPAPCISESCTENKLEFLFSHFFVVPQKVL